MPKVSSESSEYIALISKHQPAIYAFVRTMMDCAADAEDIVQETNIALWSSMDRFTLGSNFYAYATRIAYRKAIDHSRRRKRHHCLVIDTELAEQVAVAVGTAVGDRPEQRSAALEHCLSKLPPDDSRLTDLRYMQNFTVRQIACDSGRSESALQNAFSKIRKKLRLCVESTLARSTAT